jgi:hypothetical protein
MNPEKEELDFLKIVNRFNYSIQLLKICANSCGLFINENIKDENL